MSTIPKFQRYPMWMKHPQGTTTMNTPTQVNTQEQENAYAAKGYIAPALDEEFFNDASVKLHLANQLISIMLAQADYANSMGVLMRDHNRYIGQFDELQAYVKDVVDIKNQILCVPRYLSNLGKVEKFTNDLDIRIKSLEIHRESSLKAFGIIQSFLSKYFSKKLSKS